jgi:hypothetical protein
MGSRWKYKLNYSNAPEAKRGLLTVSQYPTGESRRVCQYHIFKMLNVKTRPLGFVRSAPSTRALH